MNSAPATDRIFYIISSIRKSAYSIIENELRLNGIDGLMYTHGSVLYAIYRNGGSMKLTDIAALINRRKPTVTVLVDKLESYGYVRRETDVNDSRICLVNITEKGEQISGVFKKIEKSLRKKALQGFTPVEEKQLMMLLGRIYFSLKD